MRDADFERLVRENQRAVRTYAQSIATTRTIAEDAVQDTFLRAWKYLDSFRGDGSVEGWLIRICRRCVFDLERREKRNRDLAEHHDTAVVEHPDHRSETLALLVSLPPEQREVIALCGLLGYDYSSASAILDVPVGTVRSRLHRARAALGASLEAPATDAIA